MEDFKKLEKRFFECDTKEKAEELLTECREGDVLISIHDPQGKYVGVSKSSSQFLGFAPSVLRDTSAYDYFHPEDFAEILRAHARVTTRDGADMVDYRLRMSDGSYKDVTSLSKRIVDENRDEYILSFTIERG